MTLPPEMQEAIDEAIDRMADEQTMRAVDAALVEDRNGDPAGRLRLVKIAIYARRRFVNGIEDLLDDPSILHEPDFDVRAFITAKRELATALGFEFDVLVNSLGTDFERSRFWAIIANIGKAK